MFMDLGYNIAVNFMVLVRVLGILLAKGRSTWERGVGVPGTRVIIIVREGYGLG